MKIITQTKILIPISSAELMDKIAILEVKSERIKDVKKLKNIKRELKLLRVIFNKSIKPTKELGQLFNKLRRLSAKGWDIEDKKRLCERNGDFGPEFIKAARVAFKNNDERAAVWKEINTLLKSDIVQEKSYEDY
ncbi:MAG: hypothetical protein HYT61_01270 [Candidatus Yanofskybacteria bacterium]|nr:hypothetical protein [Candidatus Yanofskybacteria bacterium]